MNSKHIFIRFRYYEAAIEFLFMYVEWNRFTAHKSRRKRQLFELLEWYEGVKLVVGCHPSQCGIPTNCNE